MCILFFPTACLFWTLIPNNGRFHVSDSRASQDSQHTAESWRPELWDQLSFNYYFWAESKDDLTNGCSLVWPIIQPKALSLPSHLDDYQNNIPDLACASWVAALMSYEPESVCFFMESISTCQLFAYFKIIHLKNPGWRENEPYKSYGS